jgi:hypothetical protein
MRIRMKRGYMQEMEIEKILPNGIRIISTESSICGSGPRRYIRESGNPREMQEAKAKGEGGGVVEKESVIKGCRVGSKQGKCFVCRHNAMRCGGDQGLSRRWKETVNNHTRRRENAIDRE